MAAGQEAAREKHISAKKGTHVYADDEDEAMVEESFSVGGSIIDEEGSAVCISFRAAELILRKFWGGPRGSQGAPRGSQEPYEGLESRIRPLRALRGP